MSFINIYGTDLMEALLYLNEFIYFGRKKNDRENNNTLSIGPVVK